MRFGHLRLVDTMIETCLLLHKAKDKHILQDKDFLADQCRVFRLTGTEGDYTQTIKLNRRLAKCDKGEKENCVQDVLIVEWFPS